MKEVALSKTINFSAIILAVAAIVIQLTTVDEMRDLILTGILLIIGVVAFLDFVNTRILSFDDRFLYLKLFKRKETVRFENILRIRRNPFRFTNNTRMNYGYTIVYLNDAGIQKKAYFYVSHANVLLWEKLKEKITGTNNSVQISE